MAQRGQDRTTLNQCSGCGIKRVTKSHTHSKEGGPKNVYCGHWRVIDKPRYVYKLGTKERIKVEE